MILDRSCNRTILLRCVYTIQTQGWKTTAFSNIKKSQEHVMSRKHIEHTLFKHKDGKLHPYM